MEGIDLPLWVGTIGMAVGTLLILLVGAKVPSGERHHVYASAGVTAIAACAYYLMTQGRFMQEVAGEQVFAARYLDWVLTTPLLLLGLLTIGMPKAGTPAGRGGIIGGVIGADVFMILTGYLAATSTDDTARWVFYVVSCLAFLGIVWAAWGVVRESAVAAGTGALYNSLLKVLTTLWFIYPILWVLGTEGTGKLSLEGEVWVFAVIDVCAKVLFGLLLVRGVASKTVTAGD